LSKEDYQKLNGSFQTFRKNTKALHPEERKTLKVSLNILLEQNKPMIFGKD